jgi:mannose-6-phosphate isomerase-like protein (cupin superfamily)
MIPEQLITGTANRRPQEAILGTGYELLIDSASTGGAYELMKFVVPPTLGPPTHMHTREDEHYYFLDGVFEVTIGDQKIDASAGTFLHLPRDVPHGLINVGQTEGSFLCWVIPGNLGGFFGQFKKPWPADQKYPPVLTRDDIQRMTEIAESFGIEAAM